MLDINSRISGGFFCKQRYFIFYYVCFGGFGDLSVEVIVKWLCESQMTMSLNTGDSRWEIYWVPDVLRSTKGFMRDFHRHDDTVVAPRRRRNGDFIAAFRTRVSPLLMFDASGLVVAADVCDILSEDMSGVIAVLLKMHPGYELWSRIDNHLFRSSSFLLAWLSHA